jgi:GR25 family glycosyltransferase involved in LPS biosynthesis
MNNYFDKIYLLNLRKRKDRLIRSSQKLNIFNIDFEIFHGVDGTILKNIWEKIDNTYFSNPNYLACAISHLSIYQDAVDSGYKRVLIIEDDNLINKNFESLFRDIPDWNDLFYLGYIPLNDDCTMWDYTWGIQSYNMVANNFFRPKNLWGLFAYGISYNLMSELLDVYNNKFPMELDRYFVNEIQPRGGSIAIAPQLFCCDEVHSDNLGFTPPNMIQKSIDSRFANVTDYI